MKENINKQLENLYRLRWNKLAYELNNIISDDKYEIKPTNPLLLNHADPKSFELADIRVMIIGQENNDWEGPFYNNFEKILSIYPRFYQGYWYPHKGQFRNHYNHIVWLLENKFPDKKISFFWSNVIKVGKANEKGLPPEYILNIVKKDFSVLNEEIAIIKPNLILFLSGPYYDGHILDQLPNLEISNIEGFPTNVLASFKIDSVENSFRTYHPVNMNFLGKEKYNEIYNTVLSKLHL